MTAAFPILPIHVVPYRIQIIIEFCHDGGCLWRSPRTLFSSSGGHCSGIRMGRRYINPSRLSSEESERTPLHSASGPLRDVSWDERKREAEVRQGIEGKNVHQFMPCMYMRMGCRTLRRRKGSCRQMIGLLGRKDVRRWGTLCLLSVSHVAGQGRFPAPLGATAMEPPHLLSKQARPYFPLYSALLVYVEAGKQPVGSAAV